MHIFFKDKIKYNKITKISPVKQMMIVGGSILIGVFTYCVYKRCVHQKDFSDVYLTDTSNDFSDDSEATQEAGPMYNVRESLQSDEESDQSDEESDQSGETYLF
jgi:hypothetical protein